ncbi:MAG: lamin tail domain-containing protein [Salinivirgaceae bacterium]|nr:lamin tail domain-containing protein [Salinivirgaceae bacterium]
MRKIAIIASLLVSVFVASAQNASDLRINEIVVDNQNGIVDGYGDHTGWIEIFNSSYSYINIGGLFISYNDNDPKDQFMIAKGLGKSRLAPREYIVFYAGNGSKQGFQCMNFELKGGQTIKLFDSNGRTLIDSVVLPDSVAADMAYARKTDGAAELVVKAATPGVSNNMVKGAKVDEFKMLDPYGLGMMCIAISVVFSALAVLFVCFKIMGKIATRKKRAAKKFVARNAETGRSANYEVNAAITLTLFLYSAQQHDEENTVLTMHRVSRNYSPWSSKIYSLRKRPDGKSF